MCVLVCVCVCVCVLVCVLVCVVCVCMHDWWSVVQWDPEPIEEGVDLLEIGDDALVNQIKKVLNSFSGKKSFCSTCESSMVVVVVMILQLVLMMILT